MDECIWLLLLCIYISVHAAACHTASNSLFMQEGPRIAREADHWHVRSVRDSGEGELYLQFYAKGQQDKPWKEYGLFFIINVRGQHRRPLFEFKLGSYKEAKEKGIFKIHKF